MGGRKSSRASDQASVPFLVSRVTPVAPWSAAAPSTAWCLQDINAALPGNLESTSSSRGNSRLGSNARHSRPLQTTGAGDFLGAAHCWSVGWVAPQHVLQATSTCGCGWMWLGTARVPSCPLRTDFVTESSSSSQVARMYLCYAYFILNKM